MHLSPTGTQLSQRCEHLVHQLLQPNAHRPWRLLDDLRRFEFVATMDPLTSLSFSASHPNAEIHLQCGPREKLGVPSLSTLSPPVSTPFDHGWSRLAFNNPTTASIRRRMHLHSTVTTPHSSTHTNSSKYPPISSRTKTNICIVTSTDVIQ